MLGVALSSQLVQGQLLLHCAASDMNSAVATQDPAGEHVHHNAHTGGTATETHEDDSPAPTTCVLRGLCGNAPAVLMPAILASGSGHRALVDAGKTATPPGLEPSPDSPPPRA